MTDKYFTIGIMEMEDKPRYSRISDIIQLIILMQSKADGVTLDDIQTEFNVSRRTAERMRDSVLNILPQVEELPVPSRTKHWGFVNYSLKELISFNYEEIAALERLKSNCDGVSKKEIENVVMKIKALNSKKLYSIEDEIEFLLHSEGFAVKQMPKYKTDYNTLSEIRQGIRENKKLTAVYNGKPKLFSPLGIILGEKIYLVAREEEKGQGEYTYLLHKIKDVKVTNETFDPKNFNLKEYSEKSFGIFQGEIYDVKLKFKQEAKEDVLNYFFHPTQKIRKNEDGTVTVTFKASGDKHIIWHLFKWGSLVKIISPLSLKQKYKEYLEEVMESV